jgi:type IV secretion system protein VirB6
MPSPYAGFTTNLLNSVDAAVKSFTQSAFQSIVQSHQTEINLVYVLYVAVFGYLVLAGSLEWSFSKAVRHVLFMGVVTALATHWDFFALFFNDVFTDGPAKLIAAVTGGSFDPNSMLSDVFDKGILAANEINKSAGLTTLGFLIIGYSVFYGTLIAIGYALFLLVLAKLALAVLLGLAPLFFLLLLFQSTRDFFTAYLRQVFNFAMIPVFTSAILSLSLKIVGDANTRLQATLATHTGHGGPDCVYALLCLAVLFMLLHQVMGLSSGVAGGLQLSSGNVAGMAAAIAINKAQLHATDTKRSLGTLSLLGAHRSGWTVGKMQSLFKRKKTS